MTARKLKEFLKDPKKFFGLVFFLVLLCGLIIGLSLVQRTAQLSGQAAASTNLYLQPASQTKAQGSLVSFSVMVTTGSNQVTGIDLIVNYNPAVLNITGIQRGTSGQVLDQQIKAPVIDNTGGQLSWSIFTLDKTKAISGTGKELFVMTGTVKTTAQGGTSPMTFSSNCAVSAVGEGVNVLAGTTPGNVVVQGVTVTSTPTPSTGSVPTATLTRVPTTTPTKVPTPTKRPTNTPRPTPSISLGPTATPTRVPAHFPSQDPEELIIKSATLRHLVFNFYILTVTATDTKNADVQLTAVSFGQLHYQPGTHLFRRTFWISKKPTSVTVKSSSGQTVTAPVVSGNR